jgi:hypothetical protein
MQAVMRDSSALEYASRNMQNNYDIVMEAVKQDPYEFIRFRARRNWHILRVKLNLRNVLAWLSQQVGR